MSPTRRLRAADKLCKLSVCYHEAGHCVMAALLKNRLGDVVLEKTTAGGWRGEMYGSREGIFPDSAVPVIMKLASGWSVEQAIGRTSHAGLTSDRECVAGELRRIDKASDTLFSDVADVLTPLWGQPGVALAVTGVAKALGKRHWLSGDEVREIIHGTLGARRFQRASWYACELAAVVEKMIHALPRVSCLHK